MIVQLLMLSGGYDSTASLVKLLSETKDDVWVHHVVLKNDEQRNEVETKSVKDIVEYCRKKYRPFKFSSSEFSYYDHYFLGWDILTVGYISTVIATSIQNRVFEALGEYPEVKVIYGISKNDTGWLADRKPRLEAMFKSNFMNCSEMGIPEPSILYIVDHMPKQEVIEYIPEDLRGMVWACRTPQKVGNDFVACGNCVSCQMLKEINYVG